MNKIISHCFIVVLYILFLSKLSTLSIQGIKHFNFYFNTKVIEKLSFDRNDLFRAALYRPYANFSQHPTILKFYGFQTVEGYHSFYPLRYKHLWAKIVEPSQKWSQLYVDHGDTLVYLFSSSQNILSFDAPEFNTELLAFLNVKYLFSTLPFNNPKSYGLKLYYEPAKEDIEKNLYIMTQKFPFRKYVEEMSKNFSIKNIFECMKNFKSYFFNTQSIFWVYILDSAAPRSFIVSQWEMMKNKEELLKKMSKKKSMDLQKQGLFLQDDLKNFILPPQYQDLKWTSKIIKYEPDYVKISGYVEKESVLILMDNYNRHWTVWVNGQKTNIFPAYYTFRGVVVPRGQFIVEFKYWDKVLIIAYVLCFLGLLGMIFLFFWLKKLRRI